jgi:hypothetical protein
MVIFSILGIFSVKYRTLAREAFNCVVRSVTLRPCETKLDQKIRSKITGKLLRSTPNLAKFIYKRFKALSWVFVILMFISFALTVRVFYNLSVYDTCDPNFTECIFKSGTVGCGGVECQEQCLCEQEICEAPEYIACKGNCTCQKQICG